MLNDVQDVKRRVRTLLAQHEDTENDKRSDVSHAEKNSSIEAKAAIYASILADPDVPRSDKELTRLQDDAIFLMMAGTDAPSQAMSITLFHILNNPDVYQKLQAELISSIPGTDLVLSLDQIEKLPYLVSTVVRPWMTGTVLQFLRAQPSEKVFVCRRS